MFMDLLGSLMNLGEEGDDTFKGLFDSLNAPPVERPAILPQSTS